MLSAAPFGQNTARGGPHSATRDEPTPFQESRTIFREDSHHIARKPTPHFVSIHTMFRPCRLCLSSPSPGAEFGGEPRSHYENAIRGALLTVNGNKVGVDYELQNSDLICNR